MKMFYICVGHNQCKRKCDPNCHYSSNFFFSRLWNEQIKPKKPIAFIKSKDGDWWEVNFDWDKNLPETYRAKPEEIIIYSYDQLVQGEVYKRVKGAKDDFAKQSGIIF